MGNHKLIQKVKENEDGTFDVISYVQLNDYLAGVVSKEMPLAWPIEALKAQAVVARSYLFARVLERKNKEYYVDSDQMDQVFQLTDSEKAYKAVKETHQVFLMDQKQNFLKAFYHSDCGGHTVPASDVWNGAIDSGTAKDPWCELRSKNKWTQKISYAEFVQTLHLSSEDFKNENSKFGNKWLKLWGVSIQKLRETFGFSNIRNSPTVVSLNQNEITFSGQGYGHGAGLCQWGTLEQARKGISYLDIIKHYYPKAILSQNTEKLASFKNLILNNISVKM